MGLTELIPEGCAVVDVPTQSSGVTKVVVSC